MKKTIIVLSVGVVGGVIFKGNVLHAIIMIGFGLYGLAPFGIFLLLYALFSARRGREFPAWFKETSKNWTLLVAALLLSYGVGMSIHSYQIRSVKAYVARAVPILDEIRKREGSYPQKLPEALGKPPWLLRTPIGYTTRGEIFQFAYSDNKGFMGGYKFNSKSRQWIYWD